MTLGDETLTGLFTVALGDETFWIWSPERFIVAEFALVFITCNSGRVEDSTIKF